MTRLRTIAACHASAAAEALPNWAPTYTLDRKIAAARKAMGEARWQQLNEEWN